MTAPYTSGTITLTNGSNIITGNGTGWATSLVVGGIVCPEATGNPLPIVSVDSDTKITAATKWRGATGTYPYAIIRDTAYGQQTVANAQALATYIQRLGNGLMPGLASLAPAANKVISFGEQSQAELIDLTATGKALLAALNGTAGYAELGTIPNAQIPTRLQATPLAVTTANALDNITETGWVKVASANLVTVNGPSGGGSGNVFTQIYDGSAASQEFVSVSSQGRRWNRRKLANIWTAWQQSQVGDVTDASSLASGDISDVVLNNGLKAQGLLSADVLYSGFDRLNTLSVSNFTKSQNGNNLVLTSTGTDPQLILPVNAQGSKSRYVAFRIKRTAGSLENIILYSTSGHGYSPSYRNGWTRENSGEWTTVVVDMWSLVSGGDDWKNSNIVNVRVDFTNASGGVIELAWIGTLRDSPSVYQQESVTDTRPGASMIVGAFGLGSQNSIPISSTSDLNSLPAVTAFYRWSVSSPPANAPIPVRSSTMIHVSFNVDAASQIVCSVNTNEMWYRAQAGGVWSSWTRIDGDVSGPTVAIDNAPVGFSGTSGKSIKQLTGPVAALHAVTGAANKLAYFTGPAAMATTDLSAFARTILDDTSGAVMFATMGATFSGSSAAGSAKLPSGLELKWGTSVNSLSDYRLLFPIAFANDCFVALPVNTFDYSGTGDRFIGVSTSNVDRNGFDIRARNITNGGGVAGQGNVPVRWLAVGW
ncbi:pyocin knob domain-containing protein [Rhizobium sp. P007]|uniref:pyocin knob domain-containing protein n=1 Tax=Rhizobium sp. P007 TaxID=285908 RepID=UPI00115AE4FD|nr:pyocin knob domain-containing protein [Rhizobium sp. P007]CAD7057708.1 hypothetical protein RP007_05711 [Rhizobium sp. P007]